MSYTVVPTSNPGDTLQASWLNTYLRDNMAYLLNRPAQSIIRDNGSNYVSGTTANTFADIDGTNLKITLNNKGSFVLLTLLATISLASTAQLADFDFTLNGTRVGAAGSDGLCFVKALGGVAGIPLSMSVLVPVTPGSNVFKPQWTPQGAYAITMYAGGGSAGTDSLVSFSAVEVA